MSLRDLQKISIFFVFNLTRAEAHGGQEAVDIMSEVLPGHYDVVLMDIKMPGMDGYTAAKRIRSLPDPVNSAVPILAMSASVLEEEKKHAREAQMNDFITKPIESEHLEKVLKEILS